MKQLTSKELRLEFVEALKWSLPHTSFPERRWQFQFLVKLQHSPMLVDEIAAVVGKQLLPVLKLQLELTMVEDPCSCIGKVSDCVRTKASLHISYIFESLELGNNNHGERYRAFK